ncbi:MAG: hypothetical protein ABI255_08725 [Microbacteriaceae bacterium]
MPKPAKRPKPTPTYQPSMRDRLRPVELLGFSGVLALFTGLVILMSTRQLALSGIGFGIAFIVSLVVVALLTLGFKPDSAELSDLDEQNRAPGEGRPGGDRPDGGSSGSKPSSDSRPST